MIFVINIFQFSPLKLKAIGRILRHLRSFSSSVIVRFHHDAERDMALQSFQCKKMEGHEIILNQTGRALVDSKASIFVVNLENETCSEFIKMFRRYGNVVRVVRPRSPVCGLLAPYGFIQYEKEMEALLAINSISPLNLRATTLNLRATTPDYMFNKYEKRFEDFLAIHCKKAKPTGNPTTPYNLPRTFGPLAYLEAARVKKPLDRFCDSYAEPNSIRVFNISRRNSYKLNELLGNQYDLLCTRFSIDHDNASCAHFQFLYSKDKKAAMKDLYQSGYSIIEVSNMWRISNL